MRHSDILSYYFAVRVLLAVIIVNRSSNAVLALEQCSNISTLSDTAFEYVPANNNGTTIICPTTGMRDTIINGTGLSVIPTYEVTNGSGLLDVCTSNDGRNLIVSTTTNVSERGTIEVTGSVDGQSVVKYKINYAPPGIYKTAKEPFILMRNDRFQAFEVYEHQFSQLKLCQVSDSGALSRIDYLDVLAVSGASMCLVTDVGALQPQASPVALQLSSVRTPVFGNVRVVIIEGDDCTSPGHTLTEVFNIRVLNDTPDATTDLPVLTTASPQPTDIGAVVGAVAASGAILIAVVIGICVCIGLRKKIFPRSTGSSITSLTHLGQLTDQETGHLAILSGPKEHHGQQYPGVTETSFSDSNECDSGCPSTPVTKNFFTVMSDRETDWHGEVKKHLTSTLNAAHVPLLGVGSDSNGASLERQLHQHLEYALFFCVIWEGEMPILSDEPLATPLPLYAQVYRILQANAGRYSHKVCFLKLGCPEVSYMKNPCHFIYRPESSTDDHFSSGRCAQCIYDKVKEDIDSVKEDIEAYRALNSKSEPSSMFPHLHKVEETTVHSDPFPRKAYLEMLMNDVQSIVKKTDEQVSRFAVKFDEHTKTIVSEVRKGPVVDDSRNDSGPEDS